MIAEEALEPVFGRKVLSRYMERAPKAGVILGGAGQGLQMGATMMKTWISWEITPIIMVIIPFVTGSAAPKR